MTGLPSCELSAVLCREVSDRSLSPFPQLEENMDQSKRYLQNVGWFDKPASLGLKSKITSAPSTSGDGFHLPEWSLRR